MRPSASLIVVALTLFVCSGAAAQVGIGTTTPSPSSVLELKSPGNNQGFLVPRMTTAQRTAPAFTAALTTSELGLLVFDTDIGKFYFWNGSSWTIIDDSTGTDSQTLSFTAGNLTISGGNTVLITGTAPGGTAGGDLSGTYPNPAVASNAITSPKISDGTIATADLADGSVNSAKVLDGTIATGDLADGSVTSAKVLDGTITSNDITDATIATADIANTAVTDAKIAAGITVAKLTASGTAGQVLTTVGTTTTWAVLPDASATNEIQDLSLATNTLSLSGDATTVNLAPYLDNTDSQNLTLGTRTGTQQPVNISGGTGITIDVADNDNSITNEIQDLSLATNTLSLSGDASTVNLAPYLDNTDAQTLTFSSPNITISGGNSINIGSINTDSQDLTLASNTLSLTGDATTVSLAAYLDNTDNQDLTLASNTLSLSGDATTVSLAPYLDNTDAQNLSLGTRTGTQQPVNISGGTSVTIDVADNDNSATNEIQDLSLTTNTLSLSGDASTVNLAPYLDNTDSQDLTLASNTLSLSGDATTVSLAAYLDNTDAQTLSFTSPNLTISGGNSINLSGINTDSQDLSLAGNTLSLTGDASAVNLAPYLDNTDSQDLTLASNTLSLTGDATTVSLAAYLDNTDAQNLSLGTRTGTQQPVNISGGTGITIDVADNDNSTTNEIQDLSLTTNTLSLSGDATTVNLAPYLDNTDAQTLTFTPATSSLAISGGNAVTVSATGTAGGDLSGSYPNPTVDALQGVGVSATGPTSGQVLKYNGTNWAPGPDNGTTPNLNAVLGTGNNAGLQAAINFSSISINRTDTPGALNVDGAHYIRITPLAAVASYTVLDDDYLIVGTATNGVQTTVSLPEASTCIGRILIFRGRSVGAATAAGVRLQAASGDTIDGNNLTGYLTPVNGSLSSVTIVAVNANEWMVISKSVFGSL